MVWATHGAPSDENSHSHLDQAGRIAVVHNGVIENYERLKQQLSEKGHTFLPTTDTEVLAHLIGEHLQRLKDAPPDASGKKAILPIAQAVMNALRKAHPRAGHHPIR